MKRFGLLTLTQLGIFFAVVASPASVRRMERNEEIIHIRDFTITMSPTGSGDDLSLSSGFEIASLVDAAFNEVLETISFGSDVDYQRVSVSAVKAMFHWPSFGGTTVLHIHEGFVVFTASSTDDLPPQGELQALLEDTINEKLVMRLQATSDFSHIEEATYSFNPKPTISPTASPSIIPTTTPTPTVNPTMIPTTAATTSPTLRPTTSPTWRPTTSPTTSPTTILTSNAPSTLYSALPSDALLEIASINPSASPLLVDPNASKVSTGRGGGGAIVGGAAAGLALAVVAVFFFVGKQKRARGDRIRELDKEGFDTRLSKFETTGLHRHDGMACSSENGSSNLGSVLRAAASTILPSLHSHTDEVVSNTSSDDTQDKEDNFYGFATVEATEIQPHIVPIVTTPNQVIPTLHSIQWQIRNFPFWQITPASPENIQSPSNMSASALGHEDGFDRWSDTYASDTDGLAEEFAPDGEWDPNDNGDENGCLQTIDPFETSTSDRSFC